VTFTHFGGVNVSSINLNYKKYSTTDENRN